MIRFILTITFVVWVAALYAQESGIKSPEQVDDSLLMRFNRGDFKGMYEYENPELKKKDPEEGFVGYFAHLLTETGRIGSAKLLNKKGTHFFFERLGEKKNERVELLISAPGILDDYFLSDFIAQPNARMGWLKTDNPLKSSLDSAVQGAASVYMSDPNSIGLSIGIFQNGKTYCYDYGEVKKGSLQLPSPDNVYNIGSIAKTFVATLLAEAVVEGKVKLDDDIRNYLPGKYPNLEYKAHPIKIVNLSNHTSGLPASPITIPPKLRDSLMKLPDSARFEYLGKQYKNFNADSLLSRMHHFSVDTIPGSKYVYNGNAMGVLILILERIYRQPYEQLLTHYLHSHLGMYNTSSEFSAANMNKFPQGYNSHGQAMPIVKVSQFISAPSINSTVHDMLKYVEANLSEKDAAVKLTHKVTFDDGNGNIVGLNWMMGRDDDGSPNIYHLGQTSAGFTSLCVFYPGDKSGYIIFVNEMISQGRLFDLEHAIRREIQNQVTQ
jgi:CubicO group peptidase (beta-lactamase class C family)